jgi:hypothetical protein
VGGIRLLKKKLTCILILMVVFFNGISVTALATEEPQIKNGVVYGNYVVTDENIKEAKKIKRIKGYLGVEAKKVDMPNLEKIEGALYITSESSKVEKISMPELKEIERLLISYDINVPVNLEELYLPNLEKIQDGIRIRHVFKTFQKFSLPNLKYVGGSINIANNQKLECIDLNSLKEAGGISISRNDKVNYIKLNSLIKITNQRANLTIKNTNIKKLNLINLKLADHIGIADNDFLKNVYLNKLQFAKSGFYIGRNKKLDKIYAPKLETLGVLKGFSIKSGDVRKKTIVIKVNQIPDYKGKIENIKFSIIKEEEIKK